MIISKKQIDYTYFGLIFFSIIFAPRYYLIDFSILIPTLLIIKYITLNNIQTALNRYKTEFALFTILLFYQMSVYFFNLSSLLYIVKSIKVIILILICNISIRICLKKELDILKIIYSVYLIFLFSILLQTIFPEFHDFIIEIYGASPGHKEHRYLGLSTDWVTTGLILGFYTVLALEYIHIYRAKKQFIFWGFSAFIAMFTARTYYVLFAISNFFQLRTIFKNKYFLLFVLIITSISIFLLHLTFPDLFSAKKLTYAIARLNILVDQITTFELGEYGSSYMLLQQIDLPKDAYHIIFGNLYPSVGFIGFSAEKIQFGAVGDSGFLIFHSHGIIGVTIIFLIDVYFVSNCFRFTRNTRKVDGYVYSCFKQCLF